MHRIALVTLALVACGPAPSPSSSATTGGRAAGSRAAEVSCPTSPGAHVFGAALCLCGDADAVGTGTWVSGGAVGINGSLQVVGDQQFSGDVVAAGGVHGVGSLHVAGSLSTAGSYDAVGEARVDQDLWVGGPFSSVGQLTVGGAVHLVDADAGVPAQLATPPCACGRDQVLDIAAAVAAATSTNDNPAAGLTAAESIGQHELRLGSGRYAFAGVEAVGEHTVTVDGAVAMYVRGDVAGVGLSRLSLTPGSTLDLYVDGNLELVGTTTLGDADRGAVRLYVSAGHTVSLVGDTTLVGSVYAPGADLDLVGTTTLEGALFAHSLEGVGQLQLRYAAPVIAQPDGPLCQGVPVVPGID